MRPRKVKAVKDTTFVENDRLGRVEILGIAIAHRSPAKSDHYPLGIAYREEEAIAEAVVMSARIALRHETCINQFLRAITAPQQEVAQDIERIWRISDFKCLNSGRGKAA